jgi:4-carboxymuconolactone decarboxylase
VSNPSSSKAKIRPVAPKLFELIEGTVYGDLWQRPQLSRRDRSLITVAALIGMRQTDQLRSHFEKALGNGVTAEEIGETITHLAVYAGFPAAISAALVAKPLLVERGLLPAEDPPARTDAQPR